MSREIKIASWFVKAQVIAVDFINNFLQNGLIVRLFLPSVKYNESLKKLNY